MSDATCGHVFPIAFSVTKNGKVLYVEQLNDTRRDSLVDRVNTMTTKVETPVEMKRMESSYRNVWRDEPACGVATTLPAHT